MRGSTLTNRRIDMSEFTFKIECLTTSAGDVDVEFDVDFDVVSDESGTEYDWYSTSSVIVTSYGEDADLVATFADLSFPFVQEIFSLCNQQIIEKCNDIHIDNNDF
jgi:hypothetical protein